MRSMLYKIWQCSWGILQTLLGLFVFLRHCRARHFWYHGALITLWDAGSSISLGLFVFVSAEPFFVKKFEDQIPAEELSRRLLVHEYGHTVQSLILGPLYLIVIGIPSSLWAFAGRGKRVKQQIPYGAFFTENWANCLGEKVTGETSIGMMVLE